MNKLNILFGLLLLGSFISADTTINKQNTTEGNPQETVQPSKDELFIKDTETSLKKLLRAKKIPSFLSRKLTKKYYKNHGYIPFWINSNGIKPIAYTLIESIKKDPVLEPFVEKIFKLEKIDTLMNDNQSIEDNIDNLMRLDIMLTSSYHKYMRYLSKGFINWKAFQKKLKSLDEKSEIIANWKKYSVKKNIRHLLYKAVKEDDIITAINEVNYTYPKADELSKIIKEYELISQNGGYIKVPSVKKSLKKGNYYPQIKFLRERLVQSNDLINNECIDIEENNLFKSEEQITTKDIDGKIAVIGIKKESNKPIKDCLELYDENLFEAVKSFQKSHGLVQDGIVGRNTIKRLNIPIEKKIKKMRINLERMRWMPRELGEKYLVVNIPDYNLKMFKEGEKKLDMPVVVGERRHPTPIFSHQVSTIVLNPYWRIPQRIVRREIIPKLVEDPYYLEKQEIRTFANWSHKSMQYDTTGVDWSMYLDNELIGNTQSAPMRFIQIPGKKNPLGRMKFLFPNKYSVYLHDTPFKRLFKNNRRAYSHGCIRLSRPHDLLKTIAEEDVRVDYNEAKEVLADIEKTDLGLTKKIPVHIIYLTSWIDENGKVQFRDDIYNYDKMHGKLLYNQSI